MKGDREHRVPLCDRAVAIIEEMRSILSSNNNNFVFPGAKRRKPLSNMALLTVLRRMDRGDLTTRGFRSTFRTWAAERTNYPHEIALSALAHVIGDKTEAAYQRGDLLAKRRRLMEAWAGFCDSKVTTSKVPGKLPALPR